MSKTIVVTRAETIYGKAIAQAIAGKGHGVIAMTDHTSSSKDQPVTELRQTPNVEVIQTDHESNASVCAGFDLIKKRYGHIDVLVCNEPGVRFGVTEVMQIEDYQQLLNRHFFSVLRSCQAVLPTMRSDRDGLIINVSSGPHYFAAPFSTGFTLAKAASELLMENLRRETNEFGIDCLTLFTGYYPPEIIRVPVEATKNKAEFYGNKIYTDLKNLETKVQAKAGRHKTITDTTVERILELMSMRNGTRPARCFINPLMKASDELLTKAIQTAEKAWREYYGIS